MFWNILFLSIIMLSLSMLGMGLNILVRKKGRFPAYRVGHNKNMAKIGIKCVKHEEIRCHKAQLKNNTSDCEGCQQLA